MVQDFLFDVSEAPFKIFIISEPQVGVSGDPPKVGMIPQGPCIQLPPGFHPALGPLQLPTRGYPGEHNTRVL